VADRIVLARSAMQSQTAVINDLANARADLAALRATLDAKRAEVQRNKDAQEVAVARVASLTTAAVSAERNVAALTATRASALAAVRAQSRLEQQRLANAEAQSRALAKRIAAAAAAAARRARLGGARVGSGGLLWPGPGGLREGVGPRTNPYTGGLSCHAGIDIGAGEGDPIRAAASGVVVMTTYNAWDGNVLIIAHSGGMATWYAHLSAFEVSSGQRVSRGQLVGRAGATGFATGPHLHFNVAINGVAYDPMGWFGGSMRTVASLCHPPYPDPTL
jgi:murein DD-endopeptidase MepM/ murein hydrolase activator NlpD